MTIVRALRRAPWSALASLRRLAGSREGVVSIEFALVAPILLLILLHLVDFGLAFNKRMKLESAARAGLQYAMVNKGDTAGIVAAVNQATDLDPSEVTVTVTEFCECGAAGAPCGTTCEDGSWPATYVRVTTDSTFTALFTLYGLQEVFNMRGSAESRVQ